MAFIEDRQIIDVSLLAAERVWIIDDYLSNKKGYSFRLNFEIAYDKVDWSFLNAVMEQEGFIRAPLPDNKLLYHGTCHWRIETRNILEGIKGGGEKKMHISHIQYADALVFSKFD